MNIHERFQAQMLLILFMCFLLIAFFVINIEKANSQDNTKHSIIIEEDRYTERTEWIDINVSARVPQSECNACREYMDYAICQRDYNICLDIK